MYARKGIQLVDLTLMHQITSHFSYFYTS